MLTSAERELRRKFIGSSDIAAILGLSPFATAADVWLDKTGRANDEETTEAMEMGNMFEAPLVDWMGQQLGRTFHRGFRVQHSNGVMAANLDGALVYPGKGEQVLVEAHAEAKFSSVKEGWGDPDTDAIPDYYLVQVAHQFACATTDEVCYVPVLFSEFGRLRRVKYVVERKAARDLIEVVEQRSCEFWAHHVQADVPPESSPSIEMAKLIRPQPGKVVKIDDKSLVEQWAKLKEEKTEADRLAREAKSLLEPFDAKLRMLMDGADAADTPLGVITAKRTKVKGYTVDPSSYVTLKFKRSEV